MFQKVEGRGCEQKNIKGVGKDDQKTGLSFKKKCILLYISKMCMLYGETDVEKKFTTYHDQHNIF